jgi:hypothetical protein
MPGGAPLATTPLSTGAGNAPNVPPATAGAANAPSSSPAPEPAPTEALDAGVGGATSAEPEPTSDAAAPAVDAGTSPTATDGCSGTDFILCEDFESTDVGDIPDGWERRGEEVAVTEAQSRRGSRSLELGAIPSWERRIAHDASALGGAHWGRIHYLVDLPVPDAFVHSTLVALSGDGPTRGRSEFRFVDTVKQAIDTPDVGSRHNFLFNVQPEDSGEFGRETSYDYTFDDQWHCVEYHVDSSNQSYAFYFEGEEVLSFEDGAGNYDRSDLPDEYDQLRVGWNNYQEAPPGFTVWMDDIAFDDERIGCEP